MTYAGIDLANNDNDDAIIGHFTFLGQEGVTLIGKELVPDTLLPPIATHPCLREPIVKNYVLSAELTDNSLDSDNLCFQVNASKEIRPDVVMQEHIAEQPAIPGIASSIAVDESTASSVLPATAVSSDKSPLHTLPEGILATPPEHIIADIAGKIRVNYTSLSPIYKPSILLRTFVCI